MSSPAPLTHDEILSAVRHWPVSERLALLQEVLETLRVEPPHSGERRSTLDRALGLASTDQPPPDDGTVEAWLAERRQERYG